MSDNSDVENERALRRELLTSPPWCIDRVAFERGVLTFGGWALPGDESSQPAIAVNGTTVHSVSWDKPRPDLAKLFWFWDGAATSGFEATLEVDVETLFASGQAELEYVDGRSMKPVTPGQSFYLPDPRVDRPPLPPVVNQARVQGVGDDGTFVLEGYSAYVKIMSAIERATGRRRDRLRNVLDWGCGCGRLARYFSGMRRTSLVGADIDAGNVEWCRQNLAYGSFEVLPLQPPCLEQLPSSHFHVVFGMSVMTHLKEDDQLAWLGELARVTKRKAVVALTVHGAATMARGSLPVSVMQQWLAHGFLDGGVNPNLLGAISDDEYYRNSFHSRSYIERCWTADFELVEHIPNHVGNHHDLVVLVKR